MDKDTEDKIVVRGTLLSTAVATIIGAIVMAGSVWNYGFAPDFPAHAQTTAANLVVFAIGGALFLGVPTCMIAFLVTLIIISIARYRKPSKPAT